MDFEIDIVARLVLAAALGSAIGLEREASDQPAGLRTHLTVALGAGLFGVISTTGFSEFETTQRASNIQFDVTRVASLVVSGIGFIGAGLIFRHGGTVRNLTTAASIWVTAAIGLSSGVGDFAPAIATTLVALFALTLLRFPRQWIRRYLRPDHDEVRIVLVPGAADRPVFDAINALDGIRVESIALGKEAGGFVLDARLQARRGVDVRERLSDVARMLDVDTLSVGGSPAE